MQLVKDDLKSVIEKLDEYLFDLWMQQIVDGTAVHSKLLPAHASLLIKLIDLSRKEVVKKLVGAPHGAQ